MIKKADIALFFVILIVGLAISWFSLSGSSSGDKVVVTVAGEPFGVYDLHKDQTVDVTQNGHTNHITIKDGTVAMAYSDCANQVCVETGAVSETKDSIVCLPNKVIVEITGKNAGGDVDVISG